MLYQQYLMEILWRSVLSTWNVASMIAELNFKAYVVLISLTARRGYSIIQCGFRQKNCPKLLECELHSSKLLPKTQYKIPSMKSL
jgi:hypothetical protein